jgi:hypothetical protein
MAMSAHGDYFVTGGHDRSLRRWERSEEPFFIDEEKEKRLAALFEGGDAENAERPTAVPEEMRAEGVVETSARKTQVTTPGHFVLQLCAACRRSAMCIRASYIRAAGQHGTCVCI